MSIARDMINERGGINGRRIDFAPFDWVNDKADIIIIGSPQGSSRRSTPS